MIMTYDIVETRLKYRNVESSRLYRDISIRLTLKFLSMCLAIGICSNTLSVYTEIFQNITYIFLLLYYNQHLLYYYIIAYYITN